METKTENKIANTIVRTVFEWVELFAISITVVMIVLNCFARYSPVDGHSMRTTLEDKDVLILSNLFYEPKQGDIVVFASKTTTYEKPYVKRVIATAGQTVWVDPATYDIYVDGEKIVDTTAYYDRVVSESAMPGLNIDPEMVGQTDRSCNMWGYLVKEHVVPEGHIFVMGDNRWNSHDSRAIGDVDVRDVLGRVVFRLMPFDKLGTVD